MKVIAMNRKDRLEDFIWENKEKLDVQSPGNNLWNKIESELNNNPKKDPNNPIFDRWKWIIIGILILAITATIFYQIGSKSNKSKAMLFAEVQSMELHFDRQANHLIKTVGYNADMLQIPDIEDIDEHIAEIKEELEELPEGSEEKALQALMESYQTKLLIIQRIMTDYEVTKPKNNTSGYNI